MLNTYLLKPRWVHLLALATLVLGGTAQAQISTTYTFLQGSRVYAPIATPDSTVGMSGEDDAEYNNIPIKMPFNFNGQTFTRLGISSNAYLVLGSGPLDGTISQVLDRGEDNVIALFDADLENQNPLSLKWDGTAPNRSFTIEYVNSRRLSNSGDVINAQIILRENGAIELSYGRIVAAPGSSDRDMQVGIRGNRGDVIALEGFFPNFTTTNTSTATVAYGPNSIPANGLLLGFRQLPPAQFDLTARSIMGEGSLTGCSRSTQEQLQIELRNRGQQAVSTATIGYRVNNQAPVTQLINFTPPLQPNENRIVPFTQTADLAAVGTYQIQGFVTATGDSLALNDTVTSAITSSPSRVLNNIRRSGSLDSARSAGWRTRSGRSNTVDSASNWTSSFSFNTASIACLIEPQDVDAYEYFYLSNTLNPGIINFTFKAAVTEDQFGTSPISNLGNDSLMLRMSTDCGQTWTTLLVFAQADFAARTITNSMRPFAVNIPASSSPVTLAFVATSGGTASTITYRWHLDDLRFSAAFNLAATTAVTPVGSTTQPFTYCTRSAFPLAFVVANQGSLPVNAIPYAYQVGNGPVVQDSVQLTLAVGQRDTINIANVRLLGQTGAYLIKVFTRLPGDGNPINDTLRINVLVPLARALPVTVLGGYNALASNGWYGTRITSGVNSGTSSWINATAFTGNPSAVVGVNGNTTAPLREYLVSPAFVQTNPSGISVRVAVTSGATQGTGVVANLGDDSLKVMYRSYCSDQWQFLQSFTQADLAAGRLANRLNQFGINLPASTTIGDTVQIAFAYTNGNSGNSVNYRWHVNNVQLLDGPVANRAVKTYTLVMAPNPTNGESTVQFGKPVKAATLRLSAMDGRLLQSTTVSGSQHTLNLSTLPRGLYLVELRTDDATYVQRLVKE